MYVLVYPAGVASLAMHPAYGPTCDCETSAFPTIRIPAHSPYCPTFFSKIETNTRFAADYGHVIPKAVGEDVPV